MSNVPADLRYAKSHEWLRSGSASEAVVGITDYAQGSLGDITYVQLPKVGAKFRAGENFGVVESVKAASDLYLPVSGTITAVNQKLENTPETVNQDPYGEGWMVKISLGSGDEAGKLMDAPAYQKSLA